MTAVERKPNSGFVTAMQRFIGDTTEHVLSVKPIDPPHQSYHIQYRGPRSMYWAELVLLPGWWCFNGDMGSWVCQRWVPMVDWTADSIIRDNEYLQGKVTAGTCKEFSKEATIRELARMAGEVEEWKEPISGILAASEDWDSQNGLGELVAEADMRHGTELILNMPYVEEPTYQWTWASICIATMLNHHDFKSEFNKHNDRSEKYGDNFVPGLKELVEAAQKQTEEDFPDERET